MNIPENIKAEFKIGFFSENHAQMVLKSIEPELETSPSDRSSVNAFLDGKR